MKKDKLFFFANFESQLYNVGNTACSTICPGHGGPA